VVTPSVGDIKFFHTNVTPELEEIPMAASIIIEQEQGTYVGSRHTHNGYYAGDFSQPRRLEASSPRVPDSHARGRDRRL
jgi:hypothetical protein